jgi:nucleotide-binding universal stress UspA family protein
MAAFKKILVPVDFGAISKEVLDLAVDLAKREGAALTLAHVWELPAYAYASMEFTPTDLLTPIRESAQQQLERTVSTVKKDVPNVTGVLKQGSAWREIVALIDETKPDLVVMGTHGRRGVERMFLGSVAEKVVRSSPVPVLTVRGKSTT